MATSNSSRQPAADSRINRAKLLLRSGEGARALSLVGDRWVLLILRDAFLGARRFQDFRRLSGAARGTLTERLNALVDHGVLYRSPYNLAPVRREYRLTERGMAFYPVALALWTWELRWGGDSGLPPKLVHKSCRKVMIPRFVCAHCNLPIDPRDVEFEPGPGAKVYALKPGLETRRRDAPTRKSAGVDTTMFHSIDTFGDRWSVMLLATLFFGLHRYDEISEALGIATNILADRLRRLLAGGIIEQRLYQDHPPRHEYHLTEKGRDLYPAVVAMHDWTTSWIPSPAGPGLKLKHRPCGHALRGKMICARCDGAVDAHTVTIKSLA